MLKSTFAFLALFLLQQSIVIVQSSSSSWLTLSGNAPVVIARGGFSGLFPDSSQDAYSLALMSSLPNVILWCDVQLTNDGLGICAPDVKLDNCTDISQFYPQGKKTYNVNGVPTSGWFAVDFTASDLSQVSLLQAIYSRTYRFDYSMLPIIAVEDLANQFQPPGLWLNIQHDLFYSQHNLSMADYIISISKTIIVDYLSSPELGFLRGIAPSLSTSKTKLIFRFLDEGVTEPTTNQTYSSLLNNLTYIKSLAEGILVPKTYIWPVSADNYLLPYTSLVIDAHKAGLEIYVADLANDNFFSYNYSYDPLAESLSFIDNGAFSVDGLLSDYPITPSEAIGCFSNLNKSSIDHGKPLIFSHNGASGDFPDCTDLAYQKAVDNGADFIDCTVQVTQDGIAICMSSIDLITDTTVIKSPFASRISIIPKIQSTAGIFTFNLTWDEIKNNLKPAISNPESPYALYRNPRNRNAGNFMTLSDFLSFAKDKPLAGVLINIEFAAFLAEYLGFSVIETVISTLENAGYSNQSALEVMIQSTDSSVLLNLKKKTAYKLMYMIEESIRDADTTSVSNIKEFANSVAVSRQSIYPETYDFTTGETDIVSKFHKAGLDVYAYVFRNEFVSQPWDFCSDATVEINAYVQGARVDGIITDFPATARAYKRNSCTKLGKNEPNYMVPIQPGQLLQLMTTQALPPALAPMPILNESSIVEPPLPVVADTAVHPTGTASAPSPQPSSAQRRICSILSVFAVVCGSLFI